MDSECIVSNYILASSFLCPLPNYSTPRISSETFLVTASYLHVPKQEEAEENEWHPTKRLHLEWNIMELVECPKYPFQARDYDGKLG